MEFTDQLDRPLVYSSLPAFKGGEGAYICQARTLAANCAEQPSGPFERQCSQVIAFRGCQMKRIGCGSIDDDVMSRDPRFYLPRNVLIAGRIGNWEASEIRSWTFTAPGSCDLVPASKQLP